jgi:hypothetical protein
MLLNFIFANFWHNKNVLRNIFLFYHFYIYSHVYTLFGLPSSTLDIFQDLKTKFLTNFQNHFTISAYVIMVPHYCEKQGLRQEWWHMPEIPATQEVEIRKIMVWGQSRQNVRTFLNQQARNCVMYLWSQIHRRTKVEGSWSEADPGEKTQDLTWNMIKNKKRL